MTREETVQAATFLCLAYNRQLSEPLLELMLADFGGWDYQQFMSAVQAHRNDPERGRFFPSLADMRYQQIGDRAQAKAAAEVAFDNNPRIDGTTSFDANQESQYKRDARRRSYVAGQVYAFEGAELGNQAAGIEQGKRRCGISHIGDIKQIGGQGDERA